jgi:hypothetical protein
MDGRIKVLLTRSQAERPTPPVDSAACRSVICRAGGLAPHRDAPTHLVSIPPHPAFPGRGISG